MTGSKLLTTIGLFAALAACGGPEDETFDADAEELRGVYDYTCHATGDLVVQPAAYLKLDHDTLKLSTKADFSDGLAGKYDPSYRGSGRSRFLDTTTVRNPFEDPHGILVTTAMRTGGMALNTGGKGGFLTLQYVGDWYASASLLCRRATNLPPPATRQDNSAYAQPAPNQPDREHRTPDDRGGAPGEPPRQPKPPTSAPTMTVEGVSMDDAQAESVRHLAQTGALGDFTKGAGLTTSQANALLAHRPYATVGDVAACPGIGTASLVKLRDWAPANGF